MVPTEILYGFCILSGITLQVDCQGQELALSTSLYNSLADVFQNLWDVNWRALQALYSTGADGLGFGANVIGKLTKTAGTTVDYANRGLGYAKDWTSRSFDYVASGLQQGVGYVSSGLNSLGSTAENYGRRLTSMSPLVKATSSSSRRRRR